MADKRFFTEMAQSMASDSKNKNVVKTLGKVDPALTALFSKKSYVPLKDVKSEFDKLIAAAKTNAEKDALMNCYDRGASYYHKYYLQVRAERNKIAKTFDATHAPNKGKKTDSKPTGKTDSKPTGKTDSKPTGKTDSKPTGKTDSKPTGKTDSKPTGKTDSKPTGKTDSKPTGKTDSKPTSKKKTVVKATSKPTESKIKTSNITKHRETLSAQAKALETAKTAATESK